MKAGVEDGGGRAGRDGWGEDVDFDGRPLALATQWFLSYLVAGVVGLSRRVWLC